MVICCYYTRVDIYIKLESPHPTHPHLSTHPTFSRLSRHPHTTKTLKQSFKHHIHSTTTIYYIYYSNTTAFNVYLIQPSNFHSHGLNILLDLHYHNHNKNRSERKPELPSFTINHFLILIINFSLHLLHPTAVILPFQIYTHNKIINNNIKPLRSEERV